MKNLLSAKLCCALCLGALPIVPALGQTVAAPVISTTPALHGAVVVSLSTTTPGASIMYALPDSYTMQQYDAPFLVDSSTTVVAFAYASNGAESGLTKKRIAIPNIPSGTLVWADEFGNSTGHIAEPNPNYWTYSTGTSSPTNPNFLGAGIQDYCAWNSSVSPCSPSEPNAYVKPHGGLSIVAREPSSGIYTTGQITTQGLFSFWYGRIEVRAKVPEAQGLWPAFWLLGNSYAIPYYWPACGEQDILERINWAGWPAEPGSGAPDWNQGSIHGTGFTGSQGLGTMYDFPNGQTAATWHTYGMIWQPGSVAFYVDNPANIYVTYTPASLENLPGAVWPFDSCYPGNCNEPAFIIINLAIGGWADNPNPSEPFPFTMNVGYVRIYKN